MMHHRLTSLIAFLSVVLVWTGAAQAQVAMTDQTYDLNEKATAALSRGEYERAIRLYRETVDLQGLNISYLNLGRAYAKSGDCARARAAYDEVPDAPAVQSVPRDKILEILYKYRLELDDQCQEEEDAPESAEPEVEVIEKPDSPPTKGSGDVLAYSLIGGGGAALGTFLAIDLFVLRAKFDALEDAETEKAHGDIEDQINAFKTVNWILLGAGLVSAGTGTVLLLLDAPESRTALVPFVSPSAGGLAWFGRF